MNTTPHQKSIEISFPSELGYEVVAREAVASFARCMGFESERIDDLKTALGEACINAIEHGNQLTPHLRTTIMCAYDNHQLFIEVRDQGLQLFAPGSTPLSIDEKVAGLGSLRGMGLLLMTQLADEASFVTDTDGGNCFRLVWYKKSTGATIQS
jgi:serine/threonine-protein kinase RsbW